MEPSSQTVEELRSKFFQRVEDEKPEFHPKDLSRAKTDDDWLKRFLIHHDLEMKEALNMLFDTCEWRSTYKVNELSDLSNVNVEYLSEGSLFVHNRDKDGKLLFIFKCKKHVKGQKDFEELKKCVIYWFERVERQDRNNQITIFFDMADTGLNNMDMEYTKYLINLCKCYYPHFLNYILIFEMPWVLNAAFKIIKSWLPTKAVQKIKFVNKNTLKEYVDSDQALRCWGGTDDFEFTFQPETSIERNDENKKKVHFADGSPLSEGIPSSFGDSKGENALSAKVKITPSDSITFHQSGDEIVGNLSISNSHDTPITYKVKTTSPEKFRVRPSCGLLPVNGSVSISVVLQSGFTGLSILKDKFLIMAFSVEHEDLTQSEIVDMWKNMDLRKLDQFRLRCSVPGATAVHNGSPGSTVLSSNSSFNTPDVEQKMSQLIDTVNHLSDCSAKLESDLKFNQNLSIFIAALVAVFGVIILYVINGLPTHGGGDNCYCEEGLGLKK